MQAGPVDELLNVSVERPPLDQLQVERLIELRASRIKNEAGRVVLPHRCPRGEGEADDRAGPGLRLHGGRLVEVTR